MTWDGLSPPYSTIVVDPPWAYPGGVSAGGTPNKPVKSFALPYSGMTVEEIRSLDVPSLAADDAWLFLWATNRYVAEGLGLLRHWGFRYRQTLVWPGAGKHSTKPAAFIDLIEAVCPPTYVELFARQPRLGWDAWGYGYESAATTRPTVDVAAPMLGGDEG